VHYWRKSLPQDDGYLAFPSEPLGLQISQNANSRVEAEFLDKKVASHGPHNPNKGRCFFEHVEDGGKSDSISTVNPDAESYSEYQDSDTEKHERPSGLNRRA
jgi:hypothetical protein